MKPRLLDLFCGAGGTAKGYHDAGFDIVGVDIVDQPHYPFEFIQNDALRGWPNYVHFDAIHASPPCQAFTAYRRRGHGVGDNYPDLIDATRHLLMNSGLPYILENVPGSPLRNHIQLCGTSFGLDVRRHRWFESNIAMLAPPCNHNQPRRFPQATNRENMRRTVEIGVWRIPLHIQQKAMGIDWMTLPELTEAIPPAFTEYIGTQLLAHLKAAA
jgi:DNA (cytosine-5)-methyltransferase 1